jgi:hypothetical protein
MRVRFVRGGGEMCIRFVRGGGEMRVRFVRGRREMRVRFVRGGKEGGGRHPPPLPTGAAARAPAAPMGSAVGESARGDLPTFCQSASLLLVLLLKCSTPEVRPIWGEGLAHRAALLARRAHHLRRRGASGGARGAYPPLQGRAAGGTAGRGGDCVVCTTPRKTSLVPGTASCQRQLHARDSFVPD